MKCESQVEWGRRKKTKHFQSSVAPGAGVLGFFLDKCSVFNSTLGVAAGCNSRRGRDVKIKMLEDARWARGQDSWWILRVVFCAELAVGRRNDGQLWGLAGLSSHTTHHVTGKLHVCSVCTLSDEAPLTAHQKLCSKHAAGKELVLQRLAD